MKRIHCHIGAPGIIRDFLFCGFVCCDFAVQNNNKAEKMKSQGRCPALLKSQRILTRRLVHPNTGEASNELTHIRARHIAPVDLNAFLCKNARLLARFHLDLGDAMAAKRYR